MPLGSLHPFLLYLSGTWYRQGTHSYPFLLKAFLRNVVRLVLGVEVYDVDVSAILVRRGNLVEAVEGGSKGSGRAPAREGKTGDALEVSDVVCDQCQTMRQSCGSDQDVGVADQVATAVEIGIQVRTPHPNIIAHRAHVAGLAPALLAGIP